MRDRADGDRARVRRERAGEKRAMQCTRSGLAKRPLDGVPLERVRSKRDLRGAVSGAWRSATDLDWRRQCPCLVARWSGIVLQQPGRSEDALGPSAVRVDARGRASAGGVRNRDCGQYEWMGGPCHNRWRESLYLTLN